MLDQPHAVTPFEARLLTILRAIVRVSPLEPALPYVLETAPAQPGLSDKCQQLLQDSLSQGCVNYLARLGWRRERFLRDGQPVTGRLWERWPATELKLTFTQHTVEFLLWLTAEDPSTGKRWDPPEDEPSIADQLVVFFAYDLLRSTEAARVWPARLRFMVNPLCRLMYASEITQQTSDPPNFAGWVTGIGGAILEALQRPLSVAWLAAEHGKQQVSNWGTMSEIAQAQEAVIDRYLDEVDRAGRPDLARFLLWGASEFCTPARTTQDLIGGLLAGVPPRLAERYQIQRQAGVLPRVLARLHTWEQRARRVGYLDEGYTPAQLFLADWSDACADAAYMQADRLVRELEPVAVNPVGRPS
ncbi:MAG: hypothetical protein ACJ8C4_20610 [Gemmataceae bacterium]